MSRASTADYAGTMLAAEIWHWWIGVVMFLAGIGAVIGLIALYLKQVSSQRYPKGRQARELDL